MPESGSEPGICRVVAPGIRCILAPNPSVMTGPGTNTFLLASANKGGGGVAVIDPGPALPRHMAAIRAALLPAERISHILITHTHLDHSGLARALSDATGAPVIGFGNAAAGRSFAMQRLAAVMEPGAGVDHDFAPDITLPDGAVVCGDGWNLTALHTPGHMGNHLCFAANNVLFTGDHVMGWSTSLVAPPDGDMTDYMASLHKLAARRWQMFLPAHGDAITDPARRTADLISQRKAREASLLSALRHGPQTVASLTVRTYPDLAAQLIPAARLNVLAHLVDLHGRNLIAAQPFIAPDAIFASR